MFDEKFIPHIFRKEYNKIISEYREELEKLQPEKGLKNVKAFKEKAEWAIENCYPRLHIKFGNAKLPKSTAIINLGTWFNCSGRKEKFCDLHEVCYAKSPEVRFKERIRDRLEQEIFWRSLRAEWIANTIVNAIREYENKTNIKVKLIRWNEVGEIRNHNDFSKIIICSDIIYKRLGIKSYVYTHNNKLDYSNYYGDYLTMNGSGFMIDNQYNVVKNKSEKLKNSNLINIKNCICDCTRCSLCSEKNGNIIFEELR